MFCTKCGANIPDDSEFCTGCGKRVITGDSKRKRKSREKLWSRKKSILLILLSIILTSVFWVFAWGLDIVSTEDEAVNIIVHLIETLGRQTTAWDKTEQIINLLSYSVSDECISNPTCVNDTIDSITALWAEIEKEGEEIENLWSKEVLSQDLRSYFSKLNKKNLNKILDVFTIYFPEESEELEPPEKLLLRR